MPLQRGTEKARPQIGGKSRKNYKLEAETRRRGRKLEARRQKVESGGRGGSEEEERKGGQARMPVPLEQGQRQAGMPAEGSGEKQMAT